MQCSGSLSKVTELENSCSIQNYHAMQYLALTSGDAHIILNLEMVYMTYIVGGCLELDFILTLGLPGSSADNLGKQFGPRSGLIRVQTV